MFSEFMKYCNINEIDTLSIWEDVEKLYRRKETRGGGSPRTYNKEIRNIFAKASEIEMPENALHMLNDLSQKPNSGKNEINKVLCIIKQEITSQLVVPYKKFIDHFE